MYHLLLLVVVYVLCLCTCECYLRLHKYVIRLHLHCQELFDKIFAGIFFKKSVSPSQPTLLTKENRVNVFAMCSA